MLATIRSRIFCLLVCCRKDVKVIICKTVIFLGVLYGCETWSLTLREERKLRVFENRVLRGNIWTEEGWSGGRVEKTA
jgi:hypothetical protein